MNAGLRSWLGCFVLGLVGTGATVGETEDTVPGPETSDAPPVAAALAAEVDVERAMIDEDLARYRAAARRRAASLPRLGELYGSLESAIASSEPGAREQARSLLERIALEEGDSGQARAAERDLAERILERLRRISLLEAQIAALERTAEPESGPIAGVWDVALLPFGQRGTFTLRQTGALVNGTYELDGGFRGSLQGTLVNRKVFLVRIDSKLGRSMELEGYLGSDGKTIRGNWLNYELAGTEAGTGQWTAARR